MSDCTNPEVGRMLHDYELHLLSVEDERIFELHIFECEHCREQLRTFSDVSRIIRHDPDARALIDSVGREQADVESSASKKKFSPYLKLLVAAIIIIVAIVAIRQAWWLPREMAAVQNLEFLPSRTGGGDILNLDNGGQAKITFFVAEGFQGKADIIVASIDGDTVLNRTGFSEFSKKGLGTIELPVDEFAIGHYVLTIRWISDTAIQNQTYFFRVE
jgi:hypothetical protein